MSYNWKIQIVVFSDCDCFHSLNTALHIPVLICVVYFFPLEYLMYLFYALQSCVDFCHTYTYVPSCKLPTPLTPLDCHKTIYSNTGWAPCVIQKPPSSHFTSAQLLSCVWLFAIPWTAALQASLSITKSQSMLQLMSIKSVIQSNHLILCCSLLLPPSIIPSIRVFSNVSVLCIRWLKYWSLSFSISPSNEYWGLISFRMD